MKVLRSACPSVLIHSCHMASPFPVDTACRSHYVAGVGSLSYVTIRHSLAPHNLQNSPFYLPLARRVLITKLMHNFLFYNNIYYIMILDMFRALRCSSSGGQIVHLQFLVSSLSVSCHTVHRLRADSALSCFTVWQLTESDDTRNCKCTT